MAPSLVAPWPERPLATRASVSRSSRGRASQGGAIPMTPGEEMKAIRKELGLSQTEFGKRLGYTGDPGRTVRDLESGTTKNAPALVAARLMLAEKRRDPLDFLPDDVKATGLDTLWELQRLAGAARISRADYRVFCHAIRILRLLFEREKHAENERRL